MTNNILNDEMRDAIMNLSIEFNKKIIKEAESKCNNINEAFSFMQSIMVGMLCNLISTMCSQLKLNEKQKNKLIESFVEIIIDGVDANINGETHFSKEVELEL